MPEILISIANKIPQLVGDVRQITSGNRDYRLRLIFDDDWEDGEKTVLFVRENGFVYPPVRTENDECVIPEVNGVPIREWLYIGVKQGEVHTSRPCGVTVYRSINDMIDDEAVQPDPSMWEDVLARLEELEANGGGGTGGGGSVPAGTDLVGHAVISLAGASYDALEMQGIAFPPDVTDEADQQRMLRAGAVKAVVSIFESEDNVEAGVLDCIEGDGLTWVFAGVMVGKNRTAFVTVTSIEDSNEYEANVLAVHEGGGSSGGDAMRLKVLAELPYEGSTPIIDMIDFTRKYTFADIAEAFVAGRTITLNTEYDVVPYQYGMFRLEKFTQSGGVGGLEFHGHYWRVKDVEADVDEGWVPAVAFIREDGTLTVEDREWSGYAKQAEVDKLSKAKADYASVPNKATVDGSTLKMQRETTATDEAGTETTETTDLFEVELPSDGGGWTIDGLTAATEIADDDAVPFYDTSAKGQRKTLWSNIKAVLKTYFDGVYLKLSGGILTGKIVFPTDNQNVGFTNSGDVKIFGYGNIDSVSHLRTGDETRPVQLRGSAERPKYNDGELVLKSEFDTVMQAYIDDIAELVGGDA